MEMLFVDSAGDRSRLQQRITQLEERVAHAEMARDNAIVMRDEVQARAKIAGQSAGARIAKFMALVRSLATSNSRSDEVEAAMKEILK